MFFLSVKQPYIYVLNVLFGQHVSTHY